MGTQSMEIVRAAFDEWRKERGERRTKVPVELIEMAVGLLARHRVQDICEGLLISRSNLLRWRTRKVSQKSGTGFSKRSMNLDKRPKVAFVEVNSPAEANTGSQSQKTIEWESFDGKRMRISGMLSLGEIGLLAERFLNSHGGVKS